MKRLTRLITAQHTLHISRNGKHPNGDISELLEKSKQSASILEPSDIFSYNSNNWKQHSSPAQIKVLDTDVVSTLRQTKESNPELKVAVLNFASPLNPCGGFLNGYIAQEEALAYTSNLYHVLSQNHLSSFYNYFSNLSDSFYSHRIIYAEDVVFFKNALHQLDKPLSVDIITAAAVNTKSFINVWKKTSEESIRQTMEERIEAIFTVAAQQQVDILILGAFGCGVFKNNPIHIKEAFEKCLEMPVFRHAFQLIKFAIYNPSDNTLLEIFEHLEETECSNISNLNKKIY